MLTASALASDILLSAPDLDGVITGQFALVLSAGFCTWVSGPGCVVSGITSGTAGVGAVLGSMQLVPTALPISAALSTAGVVGPTASSLARAVGYGIAASIVRDATYVGVSTGVGVGSDLSVVSFADPTSLALALSTSAQTQSFTGTLMPRVLSALASGICVLMTSVTGVGVVSGPPSPTGSVGVSLSSIR